MPATPSYGLRYLTLQDPPDMAAGTKNLAEDVEANLQFPVAQLYQTIEQDIPHNVFTALNFQGEAPDTHNGHSPTTNPSRWTCPAGWAGYYLVQGLVYFYNPGNSMCCHIRKNGAGVKGSLTRVGPAGGGTPDTGLASGSVVIPMNVGDYLQVFVEQNTGSTRHTFVGGDFTSGMSVNFLRRL
jgi:hypothetical protein